MIDINNLFELFYAFVINIVFINNLISMGLKYYCTHVHNEKNEKKKSLFI